MKMTFTEEDVGGNSLIPVGETVVTIADHQETTSKAGNPMVVITMKDTKGREAKEYLLDGKSKFKVYNIARACGFSDEELKSGSWDTTKLRGRKLLLVKEQTGVSMWEGKEKKDYSQSYYAAPEQGQAASTDNIPF